MVDKLLGLPAIGFALPCHLAPFAILSCDPTRCILRIPCDQVVLYSCSRISSCFLLLRLLLHSYLVPQLPQSPLRRMLSTFQDPLLFIPLLHIPYIPYMPPHQDSCERVAYSVCLAYSKAAYSVCLLKSSLLLCLSRIPPAATRPHSGQ